MTDLPDVKLKVIPSLIGNTGPAGPVGPVPYVRELLTGPRTYYVRTDGNDANTGLVNNAGGAFLTVQKAIDVAAALDSSIYDVTIQIANGTYASATGLLAKNMVGAGAIYIVGDEATPSNVVLDNPTLSSTCFFAERTLTVYELRGVKITTSSGGISFGINASRGSLVRFRNIDLGGAAGFAQALRADDNGILVATGNFTHSCGTGNGTWTAVNGQIRIQSRTITIVGSPVFAGAGFISTSSLAHIIATLNTFVGAATGVRYTGATNSVIQTNGAGANYFPGDAAGSVASGAQYT